MNRSLLSVKNGSFYDCYMPYIIMELSNAGNDLFTNLLHTKFCGMTVDLVNSGQRDIVKTVVLTYFFHRIGDHISNVAISDKDNSGVMQRFGKPFCKVTDRGKDAEKLLLFNGIIFQFTERCAGPAVVGSSEYEQCVNLVLLEKSLPEQFFKSVNK